ncbi:hypothetical protein GCM10010913_18740 [Paenibacillus aceti]|uniref:Uncharacterized protein n=1 Tax=Paenibacillus aceti TaxID=1820010 RepID=A0ABQ1VT68_9BACL|nr:hypothetical protein GCM10010913_18740 [Paenibacillus aceti]
MRLSEVVVRSGLDPGLAGLVGAGWDESGWRNEKFLQICIFFLQFGLIIKEIAQKPAYLQEFNKNRGYEP